MNESSIAKTEVLCPYLSLATTGGDDNTAKIWDLRQRKAVYTLPAHTSLISTVRWQPDSGHVLLTAGFDRQVRVYPTFSPA